MTTKTIEQELKITCPNCKSANELGACFRRVDRPNGLTEGGLLCPDCGLWTHSYWMDVALIARNERLQQIYHIYNQQPTPGRWTNYEVAREAYKKAFELFQDKYEQTKPAQQTQ